MKRLLASMTAVGLIATVGNAAELLVCNATTQACPAGFSGFTSVGDANTAAQDGDTILVWPGTYRESVIVSKNDITIRGMDRYGVLFDGDADNDNVTGQYEGGDHGIALQAGNSSGSVAPRNVTFENMQATGYTRQPFFWVNTNGYHGRYLTAVNNQVYGIYAFKSTGDALDRSTFEYSYASGHNDGGFYIGECSPCNATITHSWAERNALGYSGTNAGGNLFLEHSVWNDNLIGLLPNTLHSENDLPQRGVHIRYNEIYDNNNSDAPIRDATAIASPGIGVLVAGGWANQIYGNNVYGNDRYGIGMIWLFTPPQHNQTFSNVLWGNGVDLADGGPGSFANCFSDNVNRPGGNGADEDPSSDPPMIQELNSCRSEIDPVALQLAQSPVVAGDLALGVVTGQARYETGDRGNPDQGPAATPLTANLSDLQKAAVQCMPNPCEGISDNAFCSGGNPVGSLTKSAECS